MLLIFLSYLEAYAFSCSSFWHYYSTRMLLACFTSLLIWFILGPRFIKKLYEWKVGQKIRMEECPLLGQLHEKKKETPTMGGALILVSILVSSMLWMDLKHLYTWVLIFGSVSLGLLGAYDDFLKLKWKDTRGLGARKKLLVQVSVAAIIGLCLLSPTAERVLPLHFPQAYDFSVEATSKQAIELQAAPGRQVALGEAAVTTSHFQHFVYIPGFKTPFRLPLNILMGVILLGFFCFVITGSSNSVNLTDGLDGLAAGTIILSAICLAFVAFISNHLGICEYLRWLYIEGSGEIAIFLSAMVGSLIGFLWFNCAPAQVFMGDTGSLGLGGALGICAILLRREFLFAIAAGIFVIEALSVIAQVWSMRRYKRRILLCSPIHHHYEYKGWAETKVVIRFWIVALIFTMLALLTIKLQ